MIYDLRFNHNFKAFNETLTLTAAGDWIIYHCGRYASGPHKQAAMSASDAGLVRLTQRRIKKEGIDEFEYIAQRSSKRWRTE
jgi:hypothetical protein